MAVGTSSGRVLEVSAEVGDLLHRTCQMDRDLAYGHSDIDDDVALDKPNG